LRAGDVLLVNDTKVIPARLVARRMLLDLVLRRG
jgi:S-adenosylmethionine:tRNA-ribosyltransferase-isomerase (queuine synthetase)